MPEIAGLRLPAAWTPVAPAPTLPLVVSGVRVPDPRSVSIIIYCHCLDPLELRLMLRWLVLVEEVMSVGMCWPTLADFFSDFLVLAVMIGRRAAPCASPPATLAAPPPSPHGPLASPSVTAAWPQATRVLVGRSLAPAHLARALGLGF